MTLPVEVVKGKAKLGRLSGNTLYNYSPSEIILYGIKLGTMDAWVGEPNYVREVNVALLNQSADDNYLAALIYAFAYQGHCYYLPEPVILMVDGDGHDAQGFDFAKPYRMWLVDKLERTLQFETTSDTFEEIILQRALSGAKQPMSYASRAQLSHRGGKLSD